MMSVPTTLPTTFVWGDGGAQMTPESIAAQRRVAQAMMQQGSDFSPIRSPWQGMARIAQSLVGGLDARRADEAERANIAAERDLLAQAMLGAPMSLAPPAAAAPGAGQRPPVSMPAGSTTIPATPETDLGLNTAIQKVAQGWGVDPKYLTRVASLESNGGTNNVNPNSSARGPFQFIDSTAKQYGLTNPMDPAASADAAARLTIDNKASLTKSLGREPTAAELYLAHQQGAGGAAKLLVNPSAPVEQVIGAEAARLNGATPGMTAGQFAQKWIGKFDGTGQPSVAAPATASSALNPNILRGLTSPYVSDGTKKVLGIILQNQMNADAVTQVDLGNKVGIMDRRGNIIRTIDKGEPNKGPEFGEVGTDTQTGEKVMGWRDPRDKSVVPYRPQPATPAQASTIPPVPHGVDPKVWREARSKDAVANSLPAPFDDTAKARGELQGLPSYKNLAQAAPVYNSMFDAAGRNTKSADLNMVYALGKIMDPGSVVREGEIQMANNAQGWQEKLNGIIAQINGAGALTPAGRKALMDEAYSRIQSYKSEYDQSANFYRELAKRNRMNPLDVVQDFGDFKQWAIPVAPGGATTPPPIVVPPPNAGPVEIDGYKIKAR